MDTSSRLSLGQRAAANWETVRTSTTWQRTIRHVFSYLVLVLGSAFMLFPMLWMISASLKPGWQIFSDPPIWIPQHWETVRAGTTNRTFPLWQIQTDGETTKVLAIGVRRYTTVLNAALLDGLLSAPADQLSEAAATVVGDVVFNVRIWTSEAGARPVVALARGANDTLVVADVSAAQAAALRLPLNVVNGGDRATIELDGVEFRGRAIRVNDETRQIIPIGPESQLTVVGPPSIAESVLLVPAEQLEDAGFTPVGGTELPLARLIGSDTDYVPLVREPWQPILNEDELDQRGFVAARERLGEWAPGEVNGVTMQVTTYTPAEGEPYPVALLVLGTRESLVIPVADAASLTLAQAGGLTTARGDQIGRISFRVQDGYTEGEAENTRSVALVGEPRQMTLVVPLAAISAAFDVNPAKLERAMYPSLRFDGYQAALTTKVAETYFPTFFRNSFVLVALNVIGHVLSCVVVAYAFARLRAPGKNLLFIILLGTMMLPFPVTLVPVYEIFRDLNMVNTLWPLFLRSFFGNAFLIFMLRQFFMSIPRELEEAARIDGASALQIIWNVMVPLSKPAITTIVIFTFWWTWNSFLEPFIFLSSPELFPVSVGLNFFKDQYGTIYYDRLIAASVLSMVPMILIFFLAQRYFIEGIQLTGIKG